MILPATVAWGQSIDLSADQVERGPDGVITANGNVEVSYGDEKLMADHLRYDPNKKALDAKGNIVITSPKSEIHARSGELNTFDNTGFLIGAEMILPSGERLSADKLERLDLTTFRGTDVKFSACPVNDEAWSLAAEHVVLDQEEGELMAKNALFYIEGAPVFYTPYISEPIRRKSGFLIPSFASGRRRGTELSIPYYFAPTANLDVTLTPHWMSARGIRPELELRHVSRHGSEYLQGEFMDDTAFERNRGRIKARTRWQATPSTGFSIDADHISDRDYLADLSPDFTETSQRYLQSRATLSWEEGVNSGDLWVRHQQDLTKASNQSTLRVLPRLENQFVFPLVDDRILLHFDHQTTMFDRKLGEDGWRLNIHPYLELPWESDGGAVSLKLYTGIQHTRYWLRNALAEKTPSLSSAEIGLETMTTLERTYADGNLRHSIEPTLRYDLIGVGDQSLLPNFDSAFGQLTMENLLSNNRFSGTDRIESAHRISMLLSNRLERKGEDGAETSTIMLVKVGLSYNLRRKGIDAVVQQPARHFSNLIADATFSPFSSLDLYTRGQYDPNSRFLATVRAGVDWRSDVGHELHLAYRLTDARYVSTEEQSATVLAKLRVASRWRIMAGWHHDIIAGTNQMASLGAEYKHPCWQIQLEGYRLNRISRTTTEADLGVRVSFAFKGLGSVTP